MRFQKIKNILFLMLLLIGLSACGGSGSTDENGSGETAASDTTAPVITLNGDSPVTVEAGQNYTDANATVTDDTDATNNALIGSGTVDTSTVGSYTITYNATDAAGNAAATVTRTVNVVDSTAPAKPEITSPLSNVVITDSTPVIAGTAEAGSVIKVYADGSTVVATATADAAGDWSVTSSLFSDGSHTLTATATDASGNVSNASTAVVVIIDTTAQAPVISTPTAGAVSASATVAVAGSAEAGSTVKVYAGGSSPVASVIADATDGSWSTTTSALSDGSYTLTATATDIGGNVSALSAAVTITVDTAAPEKPAITTPQANAFIGSSTISVAGTAPANTTVKIYTGGSTLVATTTASAAGSWSATTSALSDGSYTLTASATNSAGSVSPVSTSVAVTVDTTAPAQPVVTSPLTTISYATAALNVFGTAEANAIIKVYTGGSTLVATITADGSGGWDTNTSTLSDGSYTLTVTATDSAGNVSTATTVESVIVDTAAPAAPVISSPATGASFNSTFTMSGTAEANATILIYDAGGAQITYTTVDGSGNWTRPISTLGEGSYTLTAKARDAAGNTSAASSGVVLTIDTTAPAKPAISSPSSGGATLTSTSVSMTGSAEAGAQITLYIDGNDASASGNTATADNAGAWSMAATISEGAQTLTVKAQDAAGNISVASDGVTLTVDSIAPNKPLFITSSGNVNTFTPTIEGQAEYNATIKLYDTDGTTLIGTGTAGDQSASGLWSITTSALSLGDHTITATATDAVGNTSAPSVDLVLTVVDNTAPDQPVISSPADGATVNTDTPTVSGSAEANSTITLYTGTTTLTSRGATTADSNGNWTMQSSSLSDGSYTLSAKATDDSGNTSVASAGVSITVSTAASISGAVIDGRVSGATLTLFSDADMTTQVGTGSTDANGDYSVTLSVTTAPSPIYILSSGGTDTETGLAAPTMTFVGETAGSGSLTTFNITPLTQEVYGRVRNGATLSDAQTGAATAFGFSGSTELYNDPSADTTGTLRAAAFKKLSAATAGATIGEGNYKMFAITLDEASVGVASVSSIADLVNPMSNGGAFFVEADISVDANGVISGQSGSTPNIMYFTGKVSGSSMVFNITDSTTNPTSVTRIVGNIGLNGSVSGSTSFVDNLDTTPTLQKGIFVGSLIPSTGVDMTGLEAFVNDYYTPGATTGLMNIVARDLFLAAGSVPRVNWGQAALSGIDMAGGTVTMSDLAIAVDAGSDAAATGAPQPSSFQSGAYVTTADGIPTNILVFEYQLPNSTDKLYLATVVGLRRGIYFVVPSASSRVEIAGESYLSKVNSLAPSAFTAGDTHDITTANIDLGMLGQTRDTAINQMGLAPQGVPGGMTIPGSVDTANSFMGVAEGAPELMVFQGSMFVMKSDDNDDFADNTLGGGAADDHLRVVEFFESGAMQGEEIVGGVFPNNGTPMDGDAMRNYPSTFVGFVHNQNDSTPVFSGNLNFLSRTLYALDYSGFASAYTFGSLSITAPTTTAGSATLVSTAAGSSNTLTSTLTVDVPASSAPGVYHIHGAFGASEYIDIDWPIGGTKALYAISDASDGTGTISEVGEAFLTQ